ncbi:MAG: ABC transporter ATP-binding protein [Thaumarchaeota archaeon]|jgi:peptide/nickel transport system ATP-binding protein|nr:ABC transporter ATP-binding protein [Candidatus Geocrenenecus arthurdayi]MCL7391638.1 ABC transporter ATP-binding protein [Candidatus Geocrenenecus arthurdayi]MCL7403057.1 ABC transporter ATP-binding protein [Candidatus Geocrenenecus arthurdayi]
MLLEISDLYVYYRSYWYTLKVLNGVWLRLDRGERVGIIGESGSGKTTLLKSILRILPQNGMIPKGEIRYDGKNILKLSSSELTKIRRREIGMIFQDPMAALNPVFKIRDQLYDILKYKMMIEGHNPSSRELYEEAVKIFSDVRLPDPDRVLESYPFQLSGGMRQRVMIAMALISAGKLLLADEPTTNLDVTIQDQILKLIHRLAAQRNLSTILVSHALGMVYQMTDRVYVLYAGDIMEEARTRDLFSKPKHPYTQLLVASTPRLSSVGVGEGIKGKLPDYHNPPAGCRFAPRCPYVMDKCINTKPRKIQVNREHIVSCYLYD